MHRLFVALPLPTMLGDRLLALGRGIAGVRWVEADNLHLTLQFIGEVDRHQAEDVAAALGDVRSNAITLAVEGVGSFDTRGRAHSLWAGVRRNDPLVDLQQAVGRALARAGVSLETRAFRPHITVARLPRSAGSVAEWLADHAGLRCPPVSIGAMHLLESHLGHSGASYTVGASYPFAATPGIMAGL